MNLSNKVKVTRVANAAAVGTASVNSSVIDMADYDGVQFQASFGAITDGTPNLKVQGGAAADGSDMADLASSGTALAITDDNKIAVVDVFRPSCRYVRAVAVRGGSTGAVLDGITALQYGPKKAPVTNDTTVAATNLIISPAFGTA